MIKYSSADAQNSLFRKHKKWLSETSPNPDAPSVKVMILSGATVQPIDTILQFLLTESHLAPEIMVGDYAAFEFESKFSEALVSFNPDFAYFHISSDNITDWPEITHSKEIVSKYLESAFQKFVQSFDSVLSRTNATVIINSIEAPSYRINGNYESVAHGGHVRFVNALNDKLVEYAQNNPRILYNDVAYLATKLGLDNWRDDRSFFAFKQPFTPLAVVEITRSISALVLSAIGKSKKALVLDLDNTTWGGIIGDDGWENIDIGMDTAKGESYSKFQKLVRPLLGRGIAFAIASKNDYETAKKGFDREEMVLKFDDFHIKKIDWSSKSGNISTIQKTLNIGADSIVFVDDSPFERDEVRHSLPSVYIPDVQSDPISYLKALSNEYVFEVVNITDADLNRGDSFTSMAKLAENTSSEGDISEYLESLEMTASIDPLNDTDEQRVHQLINKTNQFNLTTQRMNLAELQETASDGLVLSASLKDKNVNYGLISALWGRPLNDEVFKLENWVMSCRVFNRKLEFLFFEKLCTQLRKEGYSSIVSNFIPSEKNNPVKELHMQLGFSLDTSKGDEICYRLDISDPSSENDEELNRIYKNEK